MSTTRWWDYVQSVTDGESQQQVARHAEMDPSAVSRWKRGENPRWDFVLKFARTYNRNVLEALAAAEFITDEEAGLRDVQVGVADLPTTELLEEALRRERLRR